LVLVALFFVPAVPVGADEGSATSRGEYKLQTPVDVELKGTGNVFSNATFNITLPANATILSASVDLEGKAVVGPLTTVTADYADTTNNVAYKGTAQAATPGNKLPSTFSGETFTSYDYSAVYGQDGSCAQFYVYNWGTNSYPFHHFKFKVPLDITTKVTATWVGYGYDPYYSYGMGATAYVWNNATTNWELLGTNSGSSSQAFTKDFVGSGYIDQYNCVHILAISTAVSGSYSYPFIYSDFAKVVVQGNVLTYPKNPAMDVGANGRIEWSLTEEKFNYMANVGDVTLMNELQTLVKNSASQNVDIKVKFSASSSGKIRVSNFTVQYNAAPWCKIIPDTFAINEDSLAPKLMDLNDFFTDDRDTNKLMYEIIYQEDAKKLTCTLDLDGHTLNFKTATNNYWGALKFQIRATDSDGLVRDSNVFRVSITPINDVPVIASIPKQIAVQGTPWTMQVKVRDVDMELDAEETVTFADNSTLFDIDPASGRCGFTPKQEQVGTYLMMVTATDSEAGLDIENFTLEVQDAEDPPILEVVPDQTATENQPFTYQCVATDPDVPYGDVLTFTDSSPLFVIGASTGEISFTPVQKDIGTHKVTVTVTDARGGVASREFTLNVLNSMGTMNRPPSLDAIPNQTVNEGNLFEYQVKANDPDIDTGDALTYIDNSAVFDISGGSGKISFKPTSKDAGVYTVKITVKDREGLTAETNFVLTVIKANHAPNITSISPKAGAKYDPNKMISLSTFASDPDGDRLNYTWKDGENILGFGANITVSWPDPGTYVVTLVVTDGKIQVVNETSIEITDPVTKKKPGDGTTPGFEAVFAGAALFIAIMAIGFRRRERL